MRACRFLVLWLALLAPSLAFADTCSSLLTGPLFTGPQAIKICSFLNALPTDLVFSGTRGVRYPVQVPVPAATPVAGTNMADGRLAVVPTVAANAAVLLEATPTPGALKMLCNNGGNTIRWKGGGASTIQGSSAGGYIPIPTKACAIIFNRDGTDYMGGLLVVPTPAGP